jgi:hypothetical protein
LSQTQRDYSEEEIRQLSYQFVEKLVLPENKMAVQVKIVNGGSVSIAARSVLGRPMRLSWRFVDANGIPTSGWDYRKDLPFDIPAHGEITVTIPINTQTEVKGGTLQVSLVQEAVFWAHDVGLPPLSIPWS